MALIICPDCGKSVSDAAISCPNCGFPITKIQKNDTNKKVEMSSVIYSVGAAITLISLFFPYVYQKINMVTSIETYNYNLFSILTKESGGVNQEHPAGIMGIVPFLILIVSLSCVLMGGYEIYKKQLFPKIELKRLIPLINLILLLLFEMIGMSTYKETLHELIDAVNEILGKEVGTYGRGVGFYLIYIGIVICVLFADNGILNIIIRKGDKNE